MAKKDYKAYEPVTENKRIERSRIIEIIAEPEYIIKLCCPVEELKWIPDWKYDLIYSKSGVNETNCLFNEEMSGPHFLEKPLSTTWVTVVHNMRDYHIIFQLNLSSLASARLDFSCKKKEGDISECRWIMTFTATSDMANKISDETLSERTDLMLLLISETLKHYCETGEMMSLGGIK